MQTIFDTTFVPHPSVSRMMDRTCAVELNANYTGTVKSRHGDVPDDYRAVTDCPPIPCHPVFGESGTVEMNGVQIPGRTVRVLFASPVKVDVRHRFVWQDPDRPGVESFWYVQDQSYAPGGVLPGLGRPLGYAVDCFEPLTPELNG